MISLLSAAGNGSIDNTEGTRVAGSNTTDEGESVPPEALWRSILLQSVSGILVTINAEDRDNLDSHIRKLAREGEKAKKRDLADIDAGDSGITA